MKDRLEEQSGREEHFFCHFTHFNRRTVNGPFLLGTGINQEVSGGRWIWAVVLFTDDWLASQNHQIHLPTVTFITVIFKVTATCLVSQHWPPHIYSHFLSPSLFPSLHLSSSPVLSLGIWSVTLLLFLPPTSPFLPLLTTFIWLSFCLSPLPSPPVDATLIRSLCWAGGGEAGSGRCGERDRRGRKEKIRPPPLPLSEGCVLNPSIVRSPEMARNSFCTVPPPPYIGGGILHSPAQDVNETVSAPEWVGHSCIYMAALCRRHFKKHTGWHSSWSPGSVKTFFLCPGCNNMLLRKVCRETVLG